MFTRFFSAAAKKNSLSFLIGPPSEAPNWCCELLLLSLPNASGDVRALFRF